MWIALLMALGIGGAIWLAHLAQENARRAAEKRLLETRDLAWEWGMTHLAAIESPAKPGFWASVFGTRDHSKTEAFLANFEGISPFGVGHTMSATNIVTGDEGNRQWILFDYLYHTTHSTGKTTVTVPHPTGVLAVRIPARMPRCTLGPESFFQKLGAVLGAPEVDLEFDEFNRTYSVRCEDKQFAYDLLHPGAIEFLMSMEPQSWQIDGSLIVVTKPGYFTPEEAKETRARLDGFVSLMPEYMLADRKLHQPLPPVLQVNAQ